MEGADKLANSRSIIIIILSLGPQQWISIYTNLRYYYSKTCIIPWSRWKSDGVLKMSFKLSVKVLMSRVFIKIKYSNNVNWIAVHANTQAQPASCLQIYIAQTPDLFVLSESFLEWLKCFLTQIALEILDKTGQASHFGRLLFLSMHFQMFSCKERK